VVALAGFILTDWVGSFVVQKWWSLVNTHQTPMTNQATWEGAGAAILTRQINSFHDYNGNVKI
jgi:hypothetical protein